MLVPTLESSRVLGIVQGLGKLVSGRATVGAWTGAPGAGGVEDVLGAVQSASTAVFMALVLVTCLEAPTPAGTAVTGDGLVGSWFVALRGAGAQAIVDELMRRLVASPAGLRMIRAPSSACLVRDMCLVETRAPVVATALLRVAHVVLAGDAESDGGGEGWQAWQAWQSENVPDDVQMLVSCFECVAADMVGTEDAGTSAWSDTLGVMDACLLSASDLLMESGTSTASSNASRGLGFLLGVERGGSLGRLHAYLDHVSTLDSVIGNDARLRVMYRLRTRLLLVSSALVGRARNDCAEGYGEGNGCRESALPSIHDVDAMIDDVLFWDADGARQRRKTSTTVRARYLAYVAWIASMTLFHPRLPVFNPNPLSYSKLLCRALKYREKVDHACFPLVAWALASRVDDATEQRAVLASNTDESGRRRTSLERINGDMYLRPTVHHDWIDAEMLLAGNKLAVDDVSRHGIVVGQAQEATLRTIRNLLFPSVLFCPYATLHKLFSLSTANRNDAWVLVAVCEVFPGLVDLPALSQVPADDHVIDDSTENLGELARLLVGGVLSGVGSSVSSNKNNEAFLYAARTLLQSTGAKFFSNGDRAHDEVDGVDDATCNVRGRTLWECLPSMLRASPDRLELATDFVLDVVRGDLGGIDRHIATTIMSLCVSLLDFDNRYCRYAEDTSFFSKRTLDNAGKIVETLMGGYWSVRAQRDHEYESHGSFPAGTYRLSDQFYGALSEIETGSMNPWARLHCGMDFSEVEARYILHTNPKPSLGLITHNTLVTNVRMHQTLELAALGSIQRTELQELAAGYGSLTLFLDDLQASIRCLFAVCTSSEIMHLMTGLEIFCSTLLIREASRRASGAFQDVEPSETRESEDTPNVMAPGLASACGTAMVVELCLKAAGSSSGGGQGAQQHGASERRELRNMEDVMLPEICQYCVSSVEARDGAPHAASLTSRLFAELISYYATRASAAVPTTTAATTALEAAISVLHRRVDCHGASIVEFIHTIFPDPTTTPAFLLALQQ